jgi:lipopolysaccharide export system protein LptA
MLTMGLSLQAWSQKVDNIEIVQATDLEGGVYNEVEIRKVKGSPAIFKHKDVLMYCDSASQFVKKNTIEAYGNVRIVQGDSITLTGDRMVYNGNIRKAEMRGQQVVLVDNRMTLTTQNLDFDMNKNLAYYFNGGTIIDEKNTLKSEQGYYDTKRQYFFFKNNVNVEGRDPAFTLQSDSLEYSTVSKVAFFRGATQIISEGRVLNANEGEYDTERAISKFRGRAQIDTQDYTLSGDSLYYDEKSKIGIARQNVVLTAKKDSVIIEGDYGDYRGAEGFSKVYGNAVMKNISGLDTLFIAADTLVSIENKQDTTKRKMLAYHNIRILRDELSGRCDSLVYNYTDSTIYFYRNPVLWSEGSQLLADSMNVKLVNNKIDRMHLNVNSFIISQDSLKNFNQVKGRNMTAFFNDNKLQRVNVDGNGQSIYFATEGDTTLIGMNKVICSDMVIKFNENKVNDILFLKQPDANFVPPHELLEPEKRLKGFTWRIEEKPTKADVIRKPAQPVVIQQKKASGAQTVKAMKNVKSNKKK